MVVKSPGPCCHGSDRFLIDSPNRKAFRRVARQRVVGLGVGFGILGAVRVLNTRGSVVTLVLGDFRTAKGRCTNVQLGRNAAGFTAQTLISKGVPARLAYAFWTAYSSEYPAQEPGP
jgi:hypothetical protein